MDEFTKRVLLVCFICCASVVLLGTLWMARHVLLLLFAGGIGALVLSTLTAWLQSWLRMRRSIAFAIVVVTIATALALGIWARGPSLAERILDLQSDVPAAIHQIQTKLQSQGWSRWLIAQTMQPDQISRGITFALSRIGGAMVLTVEGLASILLIVMTSLYVGAEPDFYLRGIGRVAGSRYRQKAEACLAAATRTLRTWLFAKMLAMAVIGTLITIGLYALKIPLAGTLGMIAALLTFIPNLGPVLSVPPAALLAFAISPLKGFLTLALFALAHFLEGNLVTPLAERQIVKLPPALTLAMQLTLAAVAGPLGVAVAAPFTAVVLSVCDSLLPATPIPPRSVIKTVEPREAATCA